MKEPKKLTVTLDGIKDKFVFEGFWTGKDITLVSGHLNRQYKLYTREVRRDNVRKEETISIPASSWNHQTGDKT